MSKPARASAPAAPPTAAASNLTAAPSWVCIGHKSQYSNRQHIKVHNRRITILPPLSRNASNSVYRAIDSVCYHAGGPLTDGVLRTVAGRQCLQCPWHSYLIDVDSGEGLYMALDRTYQSKGVRQRVHKVQLRDDEHLWICLQTDGSVASDEYALARKFGADQVEALPSFPDW